MSIFIMNEWEDCQCTSSSIVGNIAVWRVLVVLEGVGWRLAERGQSVSSQ